MPITRCVHNIRDAVIFFACICPIGAVVYTGCYRMLLTLHPNENEYAVFATYGFLQFALGYITGFCTARLMYHTPPIDADEGVEEVPLLNRAAADTVETFAA